MADGTKKKRSFLSKLGFKSKDEKRAEEAAERAAAQQRVDSQMAARMAAINAAALKSAREQDESAAGLSDEDRARIEANEQREAEIQAARDVARAKQLAEERARDAEEKAKAQDATAARQAEAEARVLVARQKAAEDAGRKELEAKARREAEAKRRVEEQAQLDRLAREDAAKAAAYKARQEIEAKAREAAEAARIADEQRIAAKEKAAAQKAELERIEAERLAVETAKTDRLRREAEEADRRAEDAARRARINAEERAKEEARLAERAAKAPPVPDIDPMADGGFFNRITKGLSKSTGKMSDGVSAAFTKRKLDDSALEELEDLLIASDLGVGPAMRVTAALARDKFDKQVTDMEIKIALADVISEILTPLEKPLRLTGAKPEIMLFVGVNGSGKTTTLGKIAKRYTDEGKKVMLCAGDTFRAAAVEQLTIWGERAGAPVVSGKPGADAAALVYDAIERARDEDVDILMIDTAGRLQNRAELMDELSKVVRVINKQDPTAPHHTILVLDATVGQNALMQTEAFKNTAGVTGLIMTKLDGTAKGGVLVALSDKFKLPIHAIGIGERIEDLEYFSAPVFAAAISGVADEMVAG
ncbi:signal recognition particle-docking protein FtsY [Robiginitomaculum antarcticum]|uniref:signal recognition particle-docking protein FtsY n=1 Tax=Robiginitomaculum antarcticum TaxID=437507 RepID=UPI0003689E4B|nr:signal recognition particle-docking protein FtsY [Robiginitomaculum antarcticum]